MGAEGARRERMQRILVGLLAASLSLLGLPLRAENRTAPKGPDEDGTKPALVRIAGEGLLNSHAFGFLTELSEIGRARVGKECRAQWWTDRSKEKEVNYR